MRSIDLFNDFLMEEILELYDLNLRDDSGGCRKFHFMPRFSRPLPGKWALFTTISKRFCIDTMLLVEHDVIHSFLRV